MQDEVGGKAILNHWSSMTHLRRLNMLLVSVPQTLSGPSISVRRASVQRVQQTDACRAADSSGKSVRQKACT